MRLTLPLMTSLPAITLCALLGGTASAQTITPAQQHVQMAAHTVQAHDINSTVTEDGVNLNQCSKGPDSNCSVLTQLSSGDAIQIHCQVQASGAWWSNVTSPDYQDTGWVSNDYINGGPGQLANVPACPSK